MGSSVALSADAKTLVAGAPGSLDNTDREGYVKVYRMTDDGGGTRTQLGQTIYGNANGDWFGWSVDVTPDGNVIVVGSPGDSNDNDRPGYVRVFSFLDGDMSMSMSTSMDVAAPGDEAAMCSFCAAGMPNPDFVMPTDDGTTCSTAQAYASTLASSDIMCGTVQMAEMLCCPPDAPGDPATTVAPVDPVTTVAPVEPTDAAATTAAPVDPTDAVAVDPNEAAPEPATTLPATVIIDPAVSMPAESMPADALFGGKSGKGAKAKSMKKTAKSGKALPVKDAKAEKVKSAKATKATKVVKTESSSTRRLLD